MAERFLEPRNTTVLALALLLTAGILGAALDNPSSGLGGRAPQAIGSSGAVFVQVLGGVRTAAAAYLWVKLDDAHHAFYDGDMARERPLIPLFRIATWLDPRLEKAYYVGSYMLLLYKKPNEAVDFAREGLVNNPGSTLLTFNLGQLYLFQQGNVAKRGALLYLTLTEKMSRGADRGTRLQVLSSLNAAYTKWHVRGEPAAVVRELREMRTWAKQQQKKNPKDELEER